MLLSRRLLIVVVVAVAAAVTSLPAVAARSGFYDEKVKSLGDTARLNCNESYEYTETAYNFTDSSVMSWMMPNLTVITGPTFGDRHSVTNNNYTLEVKNVTTADLGLYHCMMKAANISAFMCRAGLNAEGPYFEDLWEKYWLNIVIGLSAGAGFLLLTFTCWLLWHFRYISPEDRERHEEEKKQSAVRLSAYYAPTEVVVPEPTSSGTSSSSSSSSEDAKSRHSSHSGDEHFALETKVGGVQNVGYESDKDRDSTTSF